MAGVNHVHSMRLGEVGGFPAADQPLDDGRPGRGGARRCGRGSPGRCLERDDLDPGAVRGHEADDGSRCWREMLVAFHTNGLRARSARAPVAGGGHDGTLVAGRLTPVGAQRVEADHGQPGAVGGDPVVLARPGQPGQDGHGDRVSSYAA